MNPLWSVSKRMIPAPIRAKLSLARSQIADADRRQVWRRDRWVAGQIRRGRQLEGRIGVVLPLL